MVLEVFEPMPGSWRWRLRQRGGKVLCVSPRSWPTKAHAKRAAQAAVDGVSGGDWSGDWID